MDSVTQAVLGAGVAAVCVPAGHRRKALLAGAMLGTLPDLDVLIDYGDPVANFTQHRGFSHSLFVLPPFAVALWLALRRGWSAVREAPWPWFAAIVLALVTHPLLDAHTVYGTQLAWPLQSAPVMWSTLFIIDPLFTLPLLVAVVPVVIRPDRSWSRTVLRAGLGLCVAYLCWSWVAKLIVEQHARDALARAGLEDAPMLSVPTPFNTLLWRVVVLTDDAYLEGFDSLLVDENPLSFSAHASGAERLEDAAASVPAVTRLRWFASGFVSADVDNGRLVVTDLRMGQEPGYVFRFAVANQGDSGWEATTPVRLPTLVTREDVSRVLERLRRP